MNTYDIILIIILVLVMAYAVRTVIRNRERGKCCGDCSSCSGCIRH